jgi:hypothetical protein
MPSVDVRTAFLRSVAAARDVLAMDEVAAAWDEPSALAELRVRGLAGHLWRGASTVEQYLDAGFPDETTDVGDAPGYYLAIALTPDLDAPLNVSVRERGEQEAAGGRGAVLAAFDGVYTRLADRLATLPEDQRIAVIGGLTLGLDDYLVTRIVELLVHTDDLAATVGMDPPDPDPESATLAIRCLVKVARQRRGDLGVLRALTRRERDRDDALRVL